MGRAIVLMYHNIGTPPPGVKLPSLYVRPSMFRFQMWYLKAAGFKVVALSEIISFLRGSGGKEKLVALTFDDGYMDFYLNAFPVLLEYGYPATVFLVSNFIGKENFWDHEKLERRKDLLDRNRIAEMKNRNVFFGSHSRTHPFLSKISDKALEDEIEGSKKALEAELGLGVDFLCYPYGDYDDRSVSLARKAGYLGALTTKRGLVHQGDDPFEIRRSFIRLGTHPLLFAIKLHSSYEDRKGRAH